MSITAHPPFVSLIIYWCKARPPANTCV